MICPVCQEKAPDDAKWCEACGQDLNAEPLPACVACGEREVAEEGYCLSCGHKQPEERDHMEFEDGPAVAVTDRGKRHRHNEDAVAIASIPGGATVLVVCDGVSSTPGSAEASLRAATAARDLLVSGLNGGSDGALPAAETVSPPEDDADPPPPAPVPAPASVPGPDLEADSEPLGSDGVPDGAIDTASLLALAVEAAQAEASASADIAAEPIPQSDGGPPSSTFVAVVVEPTEHGVDLSTAWVGDSRAYWVGERPQRLSPIDHEIAGSLVRWLGADSGDPTPDIERVSVSGTGHVVVCSDGLWRYAQDPMELTELIQRLTGEGRHGLGLAKGMVDFANDGGGHDNISVALWTNAAQPHQTPAADPAIAADPAPVADGGPEPPNSQDDAQ